MFNDFVKSFLKVPYIKQFLPVILLQVVSFRFVPRSFSFGQLAVEKPLSDPIMVHCDHSKITLSILVLKKQRLVNWRRLRISTSLT